MTANVSQTSALSKIRARLKDIKVLYLKHTGSCLENKREDRCCMKAELPTDVTRCATITMEPVQ